MDIEQTVSVRLAREDDADAIAALTREAYAKWVEVIGREPLPMQVDYSVAVRRHRFDLLHVGDRLAGLIETVPDGGYLLIESLAILPTFQGRGFGKRLLALAEHLAATSAFAGVRLYTNKLMIENIRLYEKLGYKVDHETPRNGGIAVYMMKPRGPPSFEAANG